MKKTIKIVEGMRARIRSPICVIGNFSGDNNLLGFEIFALLSKKANMHTEKSCPMCKTRSKAILPRPNWNKLVRISQY